MWEIAFSFDANAYSWFNEPLISIKFASVQKTIEKYQQ